MRGIHLGPSGWVVAILSISLGGWLVLDGSRKLLTGLYTGEDTIGLGPWANVVAALGIHPQDMAIPFVFLGVLWIVNGAMVVLRAPGRFERAILSSLLTLFYLVPGTTVSIMVLVLSVRERHRASDM